MSFLDEDARQLGYRYAQLIDNRDFAGLAEIMVPDFQLKGPGYGYNNLADFIAGLELLRTYDATLHLVGNHLGEWVGDVYHGETYCVASHVHQPTDANPAGSKMDMGIRYIDRIVRHDGVLKFASRELNLVFMQTLPLQGVSS